VITLARSLGSAVGISLMQAMFTRNLQTTYAELVPNIRTDNPVFQNQMGDVIDLGSTEGLSTIAAEVGRQAAMVSYVNDFYLSMVLTIGTIPLIFFLKPPSAGAGGGGHALPD
jgi:DHA2 family multidrug resistance protein